MRAGNSYSADTLPLLRPAKLPFLPPFETFEPLGPKLAPVDAITFLHRNADSFLTLHRKLDGCWQNLGAINPNSLQQEWPRISDYIREDGFFSINSTFGRTGPTKSSAITGLPLFSRRERSLRWLNAVYLDFDVVRSVELWRFDASLVYFFLSKLAKIGLPGPSVIARSGRGWWSLWRLQRDNSDGQPIPAFAEKIELHKQVTKRLAERLAELRADPTAVDASRVMRIPGSINTAAHPQQAEVSFYKISSQLCSLSQFADVLRISRKNVDRRSPSGPQKDDSKIKAAKARWLVPLHGFQQLSEIRGQFREGTRHNAIYLYALLLRRNRISEAEILERCSQLGRNCAPPLTHPDIVRCVRSSLAANHRNFQRSIRNSTIGEMLKISPRESSLLRPFWAIKRRSKAEQVAERRTEVVRLLEDDRTFALGRSNWTPSRTMAHRLREEGFQVSHATVTHDYAAITQANLHSSADACKTLEHALSLYEHENFYGSNHHAPEQPLNAQEITLRQLRTRTAPPVGDSGASRSRTEDEVLTPQEAARILRVSVATLLRSCRKNEIRSFRVGKLWRFRRSDLTKVGENPENEAKHSRMGEGAEKAGVRSH